MRINPEFWIYLDEVVASYPIVIDRPKGTPHPDYPDFIYPLDYGYLDGLTSMDGGGLDVWLGTSGLAQVDGVACVVNTLKRDLEIKVLFSCTPEDLDEIAEANNFGTSQRGFIVRR